MLFFILALVLLLIAIPFMNRAGKNGKAGGSSSTDEFANNDAFFTTSASDRYGEPVNASDDAQCNDTDTSADSDSGSCDSGDSGGSDGGSSD